MKNKRVLQLECTMNLKIAVGIVKAQKRETLLRKRIQKRISERLSNMLAHKII